MKLSDMKVVVTGAAGGMGSHFCRRLAEAGAQVAAGDVDEAGLARLGQIASADAPGRIHTRRLDVSDEAEVGAFVDWAHGAMGGLNGLINNAAILRDALLVKKDKKTGEVVKLSRADWQKSIDVNLTGATLMVRDVVARMLAEEQTPGVVINMSSLARYGNRGQSNYVSAKAALAANTVTWAREFCRHGIRVGAVAPGMIETPMTAGMNQKAKDALVASVPLARIGEPEDIWLAIRFMIECDYFTGRVVDVDGGLAM
jgi:3-oxoacyl-[acyl-carrier protein] reductase